MNIFAMWKKHRASQPDPARRPRYAEPPEPSALERVFADCRDFQCRRVRLGGAEGRVEAAVCYLEGMVDGSAVGEEVLRPLTEERRFAGAADSREALRLLDEGLVSFYAQQRRDSLEETVRDLLEGCCALVLDGAAVTFETKDKTGRGVEKPETEKSVKGAKAAFTEIYRLNTGLVRRRIRSPELKLLELEAGRRSRTKVGILYVEGLTNPRFPREALSRLQRLDLDGVLCSGDLEEYLLEKTSPFPQLMVTERPDRFALELLRGRAGLLVDGLPMGFLLPASFPDLLRVPEDAAAHYTVASVLTLLRFAALCISVLLPAAYVAITMYHHEMIPTRLLLSIIQSKQDVPFSTAGETLGMLAAFALLQEAGLRLPASVGQTVSIIGALIVGQSAVEARVISPAAVIVVAVSGITGYTMPDQDLASALRLCRFAMVLLSLGLGLFGMVIGALLLIYYLCTLEPFGAAYMSPFCDGSIRQALGVLLRLPLPAQKYRSPWLEPRDRRRQK
jgi:spore germination protein KA